MAARRQMLGMLAAAGLLATAACSSDGEGDRIGPAATLPVLTEPGAAALDQVTWALPYGEPDTLDPAKSGGYSPQTVVANLCDTLLRVNPDASVVPGLAQQVTWKDERTLVVDLRPDVTFWDGTPMRPQDVVYSLKRQSDPRTGGLFGGYLSTVTSVDVTGPNQVTLRTKSYDQVLFASLSSSFGAVVQEAYATKAGAGFGGPRGGLMCTGPYKLASWQPGEAITVERNDRYWDPQVKPKVAAVKFRFITDSAALTRALSSGEVDGAYEVPPGSAATLADADVGGIHLGPATQNLLLMPASADTPAADRRLMQALSLVIDRDALIKDVFGGAAEPLKGFAPPSVWSGDLAGPQFSAAYDQLPVPESGTGPALRLLAEVGAPTRPLVIAASAGDERSARTAAFVKAAAAKIGVAVEIRTLAPADMTALPYDAALRRGIDIIPAFGYVGTDAQSYLADLSAADGVFNWTGRSDAEIARLLDQARSTADRTQSAQAYIAAQARYIATAPTVSLAAPYEQLFLNRRVTGAPTSSTYLSLPWAAYLGGTT